MTVNTKALFALRKPCENCPFRKVGAIELRPGRLAGIIDNLLVDDMSPFLCHKTLDTSRCYCAGALIYLHKARMPNVAMRLGQALGMFNPDDYGDAIDDVIDPPF